MIADGRQSPTTPSVFAARPAQAGVKIVSSVHEYGACFNLIGYGFSARSVLRP
jgi:hypothetical protein